jgi:hypothetical protein
MPHYTATFFGSERTVTRVRLPGTESPQAELLGVSLSRRADRDRAPAVGLDDSVPVKFGVMQKKDTGSRLSTVDTLSVRGELVVVANLWRRGALVDITPSPKGR